MKKPTINRTILLFLLLSRLTTGTLTPRVPVPVLTLEEKQAVFSKLAARLIAHAGELGYDVTLGEAWRSEAVAASRPMRLWYSQHGEGIKNSLHTKRLAIDLNIFHARKILTKKADYEPLGVWWESQSTPLYRCRWGGRFKRTDADHFSIEHEGIQ